MEGSWRRLLERGNLAILLSVLLALLGASADRWDTTFDRPLYLALLAAIALLQFLIRRGFSLVRLTYALMVGAAGWLLLKLALLFAFERSGEVLLREFSESLIWLPTMLGWSLMTSLRLHAYQLLERVLLLLLLIGGGGLLVWSSAAGWHAAVGGSVLQLLLSAATGYLGMAYFMRQVELMRYEQGESEALARLAYTDLLTGLPNRLSLENELLGRTAEPGESFALLFVDVDAFKVVNDTLGHEVGDELLRMVAEVLRGVTRVGGQAFRLSGDEFVVLLPRHGAEQAAKVAEDLQWQLLSSAALPLGMSTTLSIGISLYPDDARSAQELLRHADSAMYAVKREGRGQVRRYQPQQDAQIERWQCLARALNMADLDREFSLVYQPIYHLELGHIVRIEALVRWQHPQLGPVSPDEFIPVAERTGHIVRLGAWVLRQACEDARQWPDLTVSVNVSAAQLSRPDFATQVRFTLEDHHLPAHRLELELTETIALYEDEQMAQNLRQLREWGVGLSIDDFGTGYSNLIRLHQLRPDGLKFDRSLLQSGHPEQRAFLHLMAQAALVLIRPGQVRLTAEGLETAEHVAAAREVGCELGQGYGLARPLNAAELGKLLNQQEAALLS